jgi:hypothetical protein
VAIFGSRLSVVLEEEMLLASGITARARLSIDKTIPEEDLNILRKLGKSHTVVSPARVDESFYCEVS